MGDLPKLAWSRDVTGKVGNIYSNLTPKAINVRVAKKINKIYSIRGPNVVFEVKYLCSGWVKMDRVNANLVLYDWPNFRYPIDFAFIPGLITNDFVN